MKKFFEFFDDEDLKSRFEIPYLKGEMDKEISKNFTKIPLSSGDENTDKLVENVLIQYPILTKFQSQLVDHDGDRFVAFYATSYKPVQGMTFYAQAGLAFIEDTYVITLILKDVEDDDQDNWEIRDYEVTEMEDVYSIMDSFMMACEKLNIVKPEDKFSIMRN
jgi:hypothetical protein